MWIKCDFQSPAKKIFFNIKVVESLTGKSGITGKATGCHARVHGKDGYNIADGYLPENLISYLQSPMFLR